MNIPIHMYYVYIHIYIQVDTLHWLDQKCLDLFSINRNFSFCHLPVFFHFSETSYCPIHLLNMNMNMKGFISALFKNTYWAFFELQTDWKFWTETFMISHKMTMCKTIVFSHIFSHVTLWKPVDHLNCMLSFDRTFVWMSSGLPETQKVKIFQSAEFYAQKLYGRST